MSVIYYVDCYYNACVVQDAKPRVGAVLYVGKPEGGRFTSMVAEIIRDDEREVQFKTLYSTNVWRRID